VELRGFWVNYDGNGTLQVGKEGDEFPFLFWTDPSPLDIHYFSFCTWTGVVGKWLYACPVANDTGNNRAQVKYCIYANILHLHTYSVIV
jgi:hypothetical protein